MGRLRKKIIMIRLRMKLMRFMSKICGLRSLGFKEEVDEHVLIKEVTDEEIDDMQIKEENEIKKEKNEGEKIKEEDYEEIN